MSIKASLGRFFFASTAPRTEQNLVTNPASRIEVLLEADHLADRLPPLILCKSCGSPQSFTFQGHVNQHGALNLFYKSVEEKAFCTFEGCELATQARSGE